MTKPVLGVSDKARLKPVFSATETSKKIEILLVRSMDMILSNKQKNKGAGDHKPPKTGFLTLSPIGDQIFCSYVGTCTLLFNSLPTKCCLLIIFANCLTL